MKSIWGKYPIKKTEVWGDYTLHIILDEPYPLFMHHVAQLARGMIVSPNVLEQFSVEEKSEGGTMPSGMPPKGAGTEGSPDGMPPSMPLVGLLSGYGPKSIDSAVMGAIDIGPGNVPAKIRCRGSVIGGGDCSRPEGAGANCCFP
ncbi:MAG: hypothetical protein AB1796_14615 [Bacillota bacterium]